MRAVERCGAVLLKGAGRHCCCGWLAGNLLLNTCMQLPDCLSLFLRLVSCCHLSCPTPTSSLITANPDNNPDFCNSCICGVGIALVLGLDAAGVQVNGQPITALAAGASGDSSAAVNSLLGSCQATLGYAVRVGLWALFCWTSQQ